MSKAFVSEFSAMQTKLITFRTCFFFFFEGPGDALPRTCYYLFNLRLFFGDRAAYLGFPCLYFLMASMLRGYDEG